MLRSNLRKLIMELSELRELEKGGGYKSTAKEGLGMTKTQLKKLRRAEKEKVKEAALSTNTSCSAVDQIFHSRTRIAARIRVLRKTILPNAWIAFSSVVATTQFSALGMVLLGILAKVYEEIGPGSVEEQEEMKGVERRRQKDIGEEREEGMFSSRNSGNVDGGKGVRKLGWSEEVGFGDLDEEFDDGGVIITRKDEELAEDDEIYGNRYERNLDESMEIVEKEKVDDYHDDIHSSTKTTTGLLQHPSLPLSPTGTINLLPISLSSSPPPSSLSNLSNSLQTKLEKRGVLQERNESRKEKKGRNRKNKETSLPHMKPTSTSNSTPTINPNIELDFFSSSSAPIPTTLPNTTTSTNKPKPHPTKRKERPEESLVSGGMVDKDKSHKKAKKKKKGDTIDDLFEGLI